MESVKPNVPLRWGRGDGGRKGGGAVGTLGYPFHPKLVTPDFSKVGTIVLSKDYRSNPMTIIPGVCGMIILFCKF